MSKILDDKLAQAIALTKLKHASARTPQDGIVKAHLAHAHRQAGNLEQALLTALEATELNADDPEPRLALARTILDLGQAHEAANRLAKLPLSLMQNPAILQLRGLIDLARGHHKEGFNLLTLAEGYDPQTLSRNQFCTEIIVNGDAAEAILLVTLLGTPCDAFWPLAHNMSAGARKSVLKP